MHIPSLYAEWNWTLQLVKVTTLSVRVLIPHSQSDTRGVKHSG